TLKDAEGCVATQATFEGTVSVEGEVEGIATITVAGTDCCCGNECGDECNGDERVFTIMIDTMPPSRTSGPDIATNTSDEATVSMGFHEDIETCGEYMATLTYATDTVTHDTTSSTFIIDGNNLKIEFSATDLASVTHATITYKGICDGYGNERQESDVKVK
ncbi:MAG: hypothetical protein J7L28_00100, partial [Thermotogae bacterium]|nr:hypothetical protein [Thermotogota bacterium]